MTARRGPDLAHLKQTSCPHSFQAVNIRSSTSSYSLYQHMCSKRVYWVRLKIRSSSHDRAVCTHCSGEELLEWRCQKVMSLKNSFISRSNTSLASCNQTPAQWRCFHMSSKQPTRQKSLLPCALSKLPLCLKKSITKFLVLVGWLGSFNHSPALVALWIPFPPRHLGLIFPK